ncbi:MAG: HAD family hydrolase, partial [Candidatus Aminicenantes bacterium]
MNKAIFLDRDGTIIEEKGYICHLAQSEIFPFAYEAVRMMNENHFKVIVITNQSAVARGICTGEQVENLHLTIQKEFLKRQAVIDRFYYCPYHTDGVIEAFKKDHPWRKPAPGMILQAAKDFDINLSQSYMIGDDLIDIQVGKNAGCQTVLVLTGKGRQTKKKLEKENIIPDLISEN